RYGRRAMAITDWPVNKDSSPSTTSGAPAASASSVAASGPRRSARPSPRFYPETRRGASCVWLSEAEPGALRARTTMVSVARMWLAVLLAVAPADAARAYSLLSYVGGDYASAVGPRGEVISRQELDEQ